MRTLMISDLSPINTNGGTSLNCEIYSSAHLGENGNAYVTYNLHFKYCEVEYVMDIRIEFSLIHIPIFRIISGIKDTMTHRMLIFTLLYEIK